MKWKKKGGKKKKNDREGGEKGALLRAPGGRGADNPFFHSLNLRKFFRFIVIANPYKTKDNLAKLEVSSSVSDASIWKTIATRFKSR